MLFLHDVPGYIINNMPHRLLFVLLVLAVALIQPAGAQPAGAQPTSEEEPVYYALEREVTLFSRPDSVNPYVRLRFREPVYLVREEGRWSYVRTQDGARGYVPSAQISNVWIRISKRKKTLYLYRGVELIQKVPADFGLNAFADKERRGSATNPDDWRTPEGGFSIVKKNPHSKFYKALVLNYPTAEDAERGRREELITQAEYIAIVEAEKALRMPPMHTALGGWIEIHGHGTGVGSNWTQGCIAIHNRHIDEIWPLVDVGTPVLIEP